MRRTEEPCASFTSSVLPSSKSDGNGINSSLSLPLGFIISPMSKTNNVSRLEEQEMHLCTTCLSYLNLYCTQKELPAKDAYSTNNDLCIWTCSICGAHNVAPSDLLYHSEATRSPIVEYRQRLTASSSSTLIPIHGQELENDYLHDEDYTMILLDASLPPEEVKAILQSFEKLQSASSSTSGGNDSGTNHRSSKVGLLIFGNMIHLYQIGLRGIASADIYHPMIYPEDCIMEEDVDTREYFGEWDQVEYCASVYFGITNNMHGTSEDVATTRNQYSKGSISANSETYAPPSSVSSKPMSRKEMLRQKKEARLKKQQQNKEKKFDGFDPEQTAALIMAKRNKSSRKSKNRHHSKRKALRCTGDATNYALHLIESMDCRTGRILIFTNGCCNFGNGSVVSDKAMDDNDVQRGGDILDPEQMQHAMEYFHSLGMEAYDEGVGIDIFCSGNGELGTQALFALAKPTSGYVLNQIAFNQDQESFQRNLSLIWNETCMSRGEMSSSNRGNAFNGVVFDMRMPDFITPKLIHGMGAIVMDEDMVDLNSNEKGIFAECYSLSSSQGLTAYEMPSEEAMDDTLTRLQIGRYDPHTSISVMFQLEGEPNSDHLSEDQQQTTFAHFQFVTRFVDPHDGNDLITRVSTQRVPISTDVSAYLQSLNDEVIPVILAKEAAYRSMISQDEEEDVGYLNTVVDQEDIEQYASQARRDLDATVHAISKAYRSQKIKGNEEENTGAFDYAVSPELCKPMKQLHHFRRGSILRAGLQSVGDRLLQRSIFLRSSLRECLHMMAPSLYRCQLGADGRIGLDPIPAETLALWDDHVLAADCYDALIVWSGRNTQYESYDCLRKACSEFLVRRSRYRFPAPSLYELKEGESMCRKLLHRLVPTHGDPPQHQLEHFPALNSLGTERLNLLRAKFRFYDADNDPSFWKWFWDVVKRDTNGKTLCD